MYKLTACTKYIKQLFPNTKQNKMMEDVEFFASVQKTAHFISDYLKYLRGEKVLSNVTLGYLSKVLDEECPQKGSNYDAILSEFKERILPGVTHWNSPHFHGYFPAGISHAGMLGELLIAGLNVVDVNWEACPASVELEVQVLNWLRKMLNLPKTFESSEQSLGGGVLQTTSGEATLVSIVAARNLALTNHSLRLSDSIKPKLVCYTSSEAHFSVERAGLIAGVTIHVIKSDSEGSLRGNSLIKAIENDLNQGLYPFCVIATLGTTNICAFDNLQELGAVCERHNLWLHVDAAYAGSALACPEFRYIGKGLEFADSVSVGLHKWMYMSYDVVAHWFKSRHSIKSSLNVDALYIKDEYMGTHLDLQHMQIGTGRKFRSLKVWMVLRSFGLEGIQDMIRRHVRLGRYMHDLMRVDGRFEIVSAGFGVLTFRLRRGRKATEALRTRINDRGNVLLTPSEFHGKYLIRFVVNYSTRREDVEYAWCEVRKCADELIF